MRIEVAGLKLASACGAKATARRLMIESLESICCNCDGPSLTMFVCFANCCRFDTRLARCSMEQHWPRMPTIVATMTHSELSLDDVSAESAMTSEDDEQQQQQRQPHDHHHHHHHGSSKQQQHAACSSSGGGGGSKQQASSSTTGLTPVMQSQCHCHLCSSSRVLYDMCTLFFSSQRFGLRSPTSHGSSCFSTFTAAQYLCRLRRSFSSDPRTFAGKLSVIRENDVHAALAASVVLDFVVNI